EAQVVALEKAKLDKEAHGEFESECPGYCVAQDTFYVGTLKGVGRIYQQTAIDTYAKVAFAKLYDRKTPLTAADLMNDRVVPFFDEHEIVVSRVLTDRGTEFCGRPEAHEYELYPAVENIDRTRTKARSPQTNGISSASARRCSMSSIAWRSARNFIAGSMSCRPTSMPGSSSTTSSGHIKGDGATAKKRRSRPSLTRCQWRR